MEGVRGGVERHWGDELGVMRQRFPWTGAWDVLMVEMNSGGLGPLDKAAATDLPALGS